MADLKYWELHSGGETGSIHLDASSATATATGLQCGYIDVLSTAVFSVLTGVSILTSSTINFKVDLGLSGITRQVGKLWPGYGRHFSTIEITSGQIAYYLKRDD
jgi:hypothetical protein